MKTDTNKFLSVLAVLLALGAAAGPAFAQPAYQLTDLGTIGGSTSVAHAINASGQIVGESVVFGEAEMHAFLYSNGTMTDLGTFGGSGSRAYAINNRGEVVGESVVFGEMERHAFLCRDGADLTDLGTLGGTRSRANGINAAGQVVGESLLADKTQRHGFVFSGGAMADVGSLGAGASSFYNTINGVNSSGQMAGVYLRTDFWSHAFVLGRGVLTDLGTLGGQSSAAMAINDFGLVVGYSTLPGETATHAFLYGGGVMNDLGTLAGSFSYALAVNNAGQVVGYSTAAVSSTDADGNVTTVTRLHAFLHTGGVMYDLNDLVDPTSAEFTVLTNAKGINDRGLIVGYGTKADGMTHAFLLTPVSTGADDEPAAPDPTSG